MESSKDKLIEKILAIELNMFLKVPTPETTRCQESSDGFKLVRGSVFESWSEQTLESYLSDLFNATRKGINLMTKKYARMDNLIPPINTNPLIDQIVNIELKWQKEMYQKYPYIFKGRTTENCGDESGSLHFSKYLKCELETYSDQTLNLYYKDLQKAIQESKNIIEERYTQMFKRMGYNSLEEANEALKE